MDRQDLGESSLGMPIRIDTAAVRLVIALALVLAFLLSSAGTSISHDPLFLAAKEAQRHAVLAAGSTDQGHVHDNGLDGERAPGHAHGHDPTDHSHDSPSPAAGATSIPRPIGRDWPLTRPAIADPGPGSRLDRPPRPISIA